MTGVTWLVLVFFCLMLPPPGQASRAGFALVSDPDVVRKVSGDREGHQLALRAGYVSKTVFSLVGWSCGFFRDSHPWDLSLFGLLTLSEPCLCSCRVPGGSFSLSPVVKCLLTAFLGTLCLAGPALMLYLLVPRRDSHPIHQKCSHDPCPNRTSGG